MARDNCGCYRRCKECARECAEKAAQPYIGALEDNWSVLSESMGELTDDELRDMADKLARGDDAGFSNAMRRKVSVYIARRVEENMDERGCDEYEAATYLADVYEAKPPAKRAAA